MASDSKQTWAGVLVLSLAFGLPRPALADVAACVAAHASGQREAKAGRLEAACASFASCVSEAGCPDTIRAECAEFRKDTERSLPTLIFAVLDEQGGDLIDVRVYDDQRLVAERLDGRPIAIDPGEHHFRFALSSGQVLASSVLVREGEKNRIVSVHAKSAQASSTQAAASNRRVLPSGFWIASGAGAAALLSWGTFALIGNGKQKNLDQCSPHCPESSRAEYDAMRRNYLIADISLAVAAASAGVATWLFFSNHGARTEYERGTKVTTPRLSVVPLVSTRAAGVVLSVGAF